MARVNATFLEKEIATLNNWLDKNKAEPHIMAQKEQAKEYYIAKLGQMDEHDLLTIEI
mgnify:CR=1 FL=1|tara:strand:- start:2463 stop:2636 length:174 start_codon:yes stop_codon:yes gene_type:complete